MKENENYDTEVRFEELIEDSEPEPPGGANLGVLQGKKSGPRSRKCLELTETDLDHCFRYLFEKMNPVVSQNLNQFASDLGWPKGRVQNAIEILEAQKRIFRTLAKTFDGHYHKQYEIHVHVGKSQDFVEKMREQEFRKRKKEEEETRLESQQPLDQAPKVASSRPLRFKKYAPPTEMWPTHVPIDQCVLCHFPARKLRMAPW